MSDSVNVLLVEDGEKALRFLRREPPYEAAPQADLVLLDLNLPRVDGREVLRSYHLGANCYVTKPIGLDQFMTVVQAIESFWLTVVKLPTRCAPKPPWPFHPPGPPHGCPTA